MCEWKDVGISHEFEKEDVAALFENWREVGRGVGEWVGGCGKGSVWGVGSFNRLRHGRLLYPYSSGHSILVKKQVAAP